MKQRKKFCQVCMIATRQWKEHAGKVHPAATANGKAKALFRRIA